MGKMMRPSLFVECALVEGVEKWDECIARNGELYEKKNDIRSPFARDSNRIMHSSAYSRLRHKTQVFFATRNDHVCTRIEHVNHVSSISHTISRYIGLNSELTDAIAIGHDLGHAPFGHAGETVINSFLVENGSKDKKFWHERNSLRFVDEIETLFGPSGEYCNMHLTYAVRDGIVCHCGEQKDPYLFPRSECIDLSYIDKPGGISPYTWEGCVVKISDKIVYLGRDIEDAVSLGILDEKKIAILNDILDSAGVPRTNAPTNTFLIHHFIIDLCKNSTPERGITLSQECFDLMHRIIDFNYKYIYDHVKVKRYKEYVKLVLETIYEALSSIDTGGDTSNLIKKFSQKTYREYSEYLDKYKINGKTSTYKRLYDLSYEKDRVLARIDFMSGMTDNYAIALFDEIISF